MSASDGPFTFRPCHAEPWGRGISPDGRPDTNFSSYNDSCYEQSTYGPCCDYHFTKDLRLSRLLLLLSNGDGVHRRELRSLIGSFRGHSTSPTSRFCYWSSTPSWTIPPSTGSISSIRRARVGLCRALNRKSRHSRRASARAEAIAAKMVGVWVRRLGDDRGWIRRTLRRQM